MESVYFKKGNIYMSQKFLEHYYDVDLATGANLHGVTPPVGETDKNQPEEKRERSSLQFNLDADISEMINDFASKIDSKNIYKEDNDEDDEPMEHHCTVLYGIHANDFQPVNNITRGDSLIPNTRPFKVTLGDVSFFEGEKDDKYDVVKIDVQSQELNDLNQRLRNSIEYTNDYPEYQPHVTIAYVKKGTAKNLTKNLDCSIFNGMDFMVKELQFMPVEGKPQRIDLNW
jgi:2'-5' RNA ligase